MKVYIVIAEDQFECSHIIDVYDSEYNAKAFCEKEYGIKIGDWTKGISTGYFFYDEDDFYVESNDKYSYDPYYNHFMLSNFEIYVREVKQ